MTVPEGRSLRRLLEPATVAVIGGDPAARAARQSGRFGFEGDIWPVHPTRRSVAGRAVYRSVDELPGAPDAAFVAVDRWKTVETVQRLAEIGCGGAVLYASGFAEAGEQGAALQERLMAGHDMPLVGPNCYGTINALNGAALWPDVHGCRRVDRGPALISQSGNIALNLTMNGRGVDFSHVISLGNQASVTVEECLAHFADRPEVTAVGLYLEAIRDTLAFGRAARACHESMTPLVALKAGRTRRAGRITESHTAALLAPAASYDALLARYGVVSVETLPEFMTTLGMLGTVGPLPGNRLVSLSCSGGEAALVADRATHHAVVFEPFAPEHAGRVKATLSDLVSISNPLDYHTFIWGDAEALERCFTEALTGPFDAALLVLDWPSDGNDDSDWWPTLRAFGAAAEATGTPAAIASGLAENLPARIRDYAAARGLGVAYSIDEALAGLAAAAATGRWFATEAHPLHLPPGQAGPEGAYRTLDEPSGKVLLREGGIRVPEGAVVSGADLGAAYESTARLGFPLVAKTVGPAHKAAVGGVVSGIRTRDELGSALRRLGSGDRPVLVEEQVTGGLAELLVSVRREPPIGLVLTVGSGGTRVELVSDKTTILLPAPMPVLRRAVKRIRFGRRPLPPGAVVEVLDALIYRFIRLLGDRPELVEMEVNPLILTPGAAWAVDALVTCAPREGVDTLPPP